MVLRDIRLGLYGGIEQAEGWQILNKYSINTNNWHHNLDVRQG